MTNPDQPPTVPGYVYDMQQADPTPAGPPPVQPEQPRRRRTGLIVGAVALAVVLTAGIWTGVATLGQHGATANGSPSVAPPSNASPFQHAQDSCIVGQGNTSIEDGGKTLIIDGSGEDDATGIGVDELTCVLGQLKMPAAVKEHVFETRALDGRQEDRWDGFSASWSYHPDDGLDMIVRAE